MFRFKKIALVVTVAATLAPAAQAADKSDAVDRALRNNAAPLDVRSPDRKSPARQWTQPDAVDRALVNASYISPDAVDRYLARTSSGTQVDFRSADTRDAAIGRYPHSGPVLVSVPGGFDWGDATFGAGAAALALVLAGGIAIAVRQRKRVVLS